MENLNIDDLKLELQALQAKDTEDAKKAGFKTKDDWTLYKLNHPEMKDEIAEALIDIAKRYNVSLGTLAAIYDKGLSMFLRVQSV